MPANPSTPGVYVEEVPGGARSIIGAETSIAAFVGRARRGPVDTAVAIDSFDDFTQVFGGLWAESKLSFAIRDFYRNGGSQAVVVRLINDTNERAADAGRASDGVPLAAENFLPSGGRRDRKGIFALEQVELFNLLCIPPFLEVEDWAVHAGVLAEATTYCEARRAMLLVDPPTPSAAFGSRRRGRERRWKALAP